VRKTTASIGIVAHTSRAQQAHRLNNTFDADYLNIDDGTLGCTGNHLNVWHWLHHNTSTEWSIVLEDDALPIADFRAQAAAALTVAPAPIVSFYLGSYPPHFDPDKEHAIVQADNTDADWIVAPFLFHAVAVAIRTDQLGPILNHCGVNEPAPIDQAISSYPATVAYTWPSLVNHHDGPSATNHPDGIQRGVSRTAYRTGTRGIWTGSFVAL
jgi:GR25 family glycosyltransferase involved in LPS biosynthesis